MSEQTRRRFLLSSGAAGVTAVAGCLRLTAEDGEASTAQRTATTGVTTSNNQESDSTNTSNSQGTDVTNTSNSQDTNRTSTAVTESTPTVFQGFESTEWSEGIGFGTQNITDQYATDETFEASRSCKFDHPSTKTWNYIDTPSSDYEGVNVEVYVRKDVLSGDDQYKFNQIRIGNSSEKNFKSYRITGTNASGDYAIKVLEINDDSVTTKNTFTSSQIDYSKWYKMTVDHNGLNWSVTFTDTTTGRVVLSENGTHNTATPEGIVRFDSFSSYNLAKTEWFDNIQIRKI